MRGSKTHAKIIPLGVGRALPEPPAWLTKGARKEWRRCAADLSRRGLLFDGALASLAAYCVLTDQVERLSQRAEVEGLVGETQGSPSQRTMLSTIAQARMLASELGLNVVSRSRSFTAQATAQGDGFEDLVG